ncbi:MAG: hypothetical protein HY286_18765 [Planctomycetes bacterium]|nr:hypothetical protein [Planctomycetota bacterium]
MGILKKLFAVAFGTIAGFALVEGGARVWIRIAPPKILKNQEETVLYQPHHHLSYEIAPNAPSMLMRGPHNSLGFRGPELEARKSDVFRIICIGGSTTYGTRNVNESECWPRILESMLSARGIAVEVINAGVPAYTSAECLQLLREKALPLDPDLVILYMGANDIMPRFAPDFRSDYSHYRRTWKKPEMPAPPEPGPLAIVNLMKTRTEPRAPVKALRAMTSKPYREVPEVERAAWARSNTLTFQRNMRTMVDACRGAGSSVLLATQSYAASRIVEGFGELRAQFFREGLPQNSAVVREVARQTNAPLIDFEKDPIPLQGFDDYVHHNAFGSHAVAAAVSRAIIEKSLLQRRPR